MFYDGKDLPLYLYWEWTKFERTKDETHRENIKKCYEIVSNRANKDDKEWFEQKWAAMVLKRGVFFD